MAAAFPGVFRRLEWGRDKCKKGYTPSHAHTHVYTWLLLERKRSPGTSVTSHWPEQFKSSPGRWQRGCFRLSTFLIEKDKEKSVINSHCVDNSQCPLQSPCEKCRGGQTWQPTPGKEPGGKGWVLSMAHRSLPLLMPLPTPPPHIPSYATIHIGFLFPIFWMLPIVLCLHDFSRALLCAWVPALSPLPVHVVPMPCASREEYHNKQDH